MFESRRPSFLEASVGPWRPMATYVLLGVMAGVYVLELVVLAASEGWFRALFVIDVDWPWRPWSLVTSTLSHSPDPTHLLFNALFLYFFGPPVERIVGVRRFVILFLVAGAASGVVQVHLESAIGGSGGALGASGALMMLFGALLALVPKAKVMVWGLVPVPLWIAGIGYAALDVLGAFNPADGIGNFAHLAGLAIGLGYGLWLKGDLKRRGLRLVQP